MLFSNCYTCNVTVGGDAVRAHLPALPEASSSNGAVGSSFSFSSSVVERTYTQRLRINSTILIPRFVLKVVPIKVILNSKSVVQLSIKFTKLAIFST